MRLAHSKKIVGLHTPTEVEAFANGTNTFINLNTQYTIIGVSFNGLSSKTVPIQTQDVNVAKTDMDIAHGIFRYIATRKNKTSTREAAEELLVKSCSYKKLFYNNQNDVSDNGIANNTMTFNQKIDDACADAKKVLNKETYDNISRGIGKLPFHL